MYFNAKIQDILSRKNSIVRCGIKRLGFSEILTSITFIFLSFIFFFCAKLPLLSNLFTSSVHSLLQPMHIEVIGIFLYYNSELFEVLKIILSFIMSVLFPFHFSMLFV